MGIGYIFGCLFSILFWKVDRQKLFCRLDSFLNKILKNRFVVGFIYAALAILLMDSLSLVKDKRELFNFITAFLVVDISNSEKKNLELKNKIRFYDSITVACKGLLSGFVAPLFYIIIFSSNIAGIVYTIIYNINETKRYKSYEFIYILLSILPAFMIQIMFYIIYVFRNKVFQIDFKGDYLINTLSRPLLNLEIMAAYIESVNFYYHFNEEDMSYVKSYGKYNNKINDVCIKDYLSITYGIAFIYFAIFILLVCF